MTRKPTLLERIFQTQVLQAGLPSPVPEYEFHDTRRWRFDFAWLPQHLAVEIEGGTWAGGRHVRGGGFEEDCYKYNAAVEKGWRVLRFTGGMVQSGEALEATRRVLGY